MHAIGYIFIFPLLLKVIMCEQKETDALERKLGVIVCCFLCGLFPTFEKSVQFTKGFVSFRFVYLII